MRDRSKKLKTGHNIKYCEIEHNILYAKPKKIIFFWINFLSKRDKNYLQTLSILHQENQFTA